MNRYVCRTRLGTFLIQPAPSGGWAIFFGGDYLDGPFPSAQAAAEDLSGGHCAWPTIGDPATLGIPDQIEDWQPV